MKWITANDLNRWADTIESRGLLPELIKRLIAATLPICDACIFPSRESIQLPGWDGVLRADSQVDIVPIGTSLWELGTNKDVSGKINDDFNKRTSTPLGYDITDSTFVFVTLRNWGAADQWRNTKKQESEWKGIKVYTSFELEDWLEKTPSVALWLLKVVDKVVEVGFERIEDFWERWSTNGKCTLDYNLLLGGREKEISKIKEVVSKPSVTLVSALSIVEAKAFVVASILTKQNYDVISKAIIVHSDNELKRIIDKFSNLIIITDVNGKDYNYAVNKGHTIIYLGCPADEIDNEQFVSLPPINLQCFIKSLVKSGFSNKESQELSTKTARDIAILRRDLQFTSSIPKWGDPKIVKTLIPAILVGGWEDNNVKDREVISLMANQPYKDYIKELNVMRYDDDFPFLCINGYWRLKSPHEAVVLVAKYLTNNDFDKLQAVFKMLFLAPNENIFKELNPVASACNQFLTKDKDPRYSSRIRSWLLQEMLLISRTKIDAVNCSSYVNELVSSALENSCLKWWLTYNKYITRLAQISPKCFIEFIEADLKLDDSIMHQLFSFKGDGDYFFLGIDTVYYINVLKGLEHLAHTNQFLVKVCRALVDLSSYTIDSHFQEHPKESLFKLLGIYDDSLNIGFDNKAKVFSGLMKRDSDLCFDLGYRIINDFSYQFDGAFGVTNQRLQELTNYAEALLKSMITKTDYTDSQVCKIITVFDFNLPFSDSGFLNDFISNQIGSFKCNNKLISKLHRLIARSTQKGDVFQEYVDKYQGWLMTIQPDRLTEKYQIFFASNSDRYFFNNTDDTENALLEFRRKKLLEIIDRYGLCGLFELAELCEWPYLIGEAMFEIVSEQQICELYSQMELTDKKITFYKYLLGKYIDNVGLESFLPLVKELCKLDESKVYIPLTSIIVTKKAIAYVDTLSSRTQELYWENVSLSPKYIESEDVVSVIDILKDNGRIEDAVDLLYRIKNDSLNTLTANLLYKIGTSQLGVNEENNFIARQIAKLIIRLDKSKDVNVAMIIQLEMMFYHLIKHVYQKQDLRLFDELLSNPLSMFTVFKASCFIFDSPEDELRTEKGKRTAYFTAKNILDDIKMVPCSNLDGTLNRTKVDNYILELRKLSSCNDMQSKVDHFLGELLSNYPESEDYPPVELAELIEAQENEDINKGFFSGIYTRYTTGFSDAYTNGATDTRLAVKFKGYSNKIQYEYPTMCTIFDSLHNIFMERAEKDKSDTYLYSLEG